MIDEAVLQYRGLKSYFVRRSRGGGVKDVAAPTGPIFHRVEFHLHHLIEFTLVQ